LRIIFINSGIWTFWNNFCGESYIVDISRILLSGSIIISITLSPGNWNDRYVIRSVYEEGKSWFTFEVDLRFPLTYILTGISYDAALPRFLILKETGEEIPL